MVYGKTLKNKSALRGFPNSCRTISFKKRTFRQSSRNLFDFFAICFKKEIIIQEWPGLSLSHTAPGHASYRGKAEYLLFSRNTARLWENPPSCIRTFFCKTGEGGQECSAPARQGLFCAALQISFFFQFLAIP